MVSLLNSKRVNILHTLHKQKIISFHKCLELFYFYNSYLLSSNDLILSSNSFTLILLLFKLFKIELIRLSIFFITKIPLSFLFISAMFFLSQHLLCCFVAFPLCPHLGVAKTWTLIASSRLPSIARKRTAVPSCRLASRSTFSRWPGESIHSRRSCRARDS